MISSECSEVGHGTTLITVATSDGIVMAADALVHVERGSEAVPIYDTFQKVFGLASNILIGTCGAGDYPGIEYEFQRWIIEFIQTQTSDSAFKRPGDVAAELYTKMRRTFERVESRPDDNLWQTHRPGDRIVSYVVAGYAESFQRPYIFELGTEVQGHQKARYIEPIRSANDNLWIGEDYHFRRAQNGLQPERAAWESITKSVDIIASPNIPEALKDITVSVTGLVKVESQFNPKKVGANVAVGIIDRRQKRSLMLFV